MSIVNCQHCAEFIDSDVYPECFYLETEDGQCVVLSNPMCVSCKEKIFG